MAVEIDLFLVHLKSEDLSPGTVSTYQGNLLLFDQWLTQNGLTVATLTRSNLVDYKTELKRTYKPATINLKLTCVSLLLQWSVKSGLISESPMTRIKLLRQENYPKWLTKEQVGKIFQAAQGAIERARAKQLEFSTIIAIRQYAIAVFLLHTGLRVSELCDLKLTDVKNGVITVKWGKGAKRREVPMNEQAREALEIWLEVRGLDSDYIFSTKGRMTRRLVQFHLSELGKGAGFRLTPHLLRHTFGKRLADKGVPLDRIAKLMGHSDINTTAIYTMPSLDDLRLAVELLD